MINPITGEQVDMPKKILKIGNEEVKGFDGNMPEMHVWTDSLGVSRNLEISSNQIFKTVTLEITLENKIQTYIAILKDEVKVLK